MSSTHKICPECGTHGPGTNLFCVECGASLQGVLPVTGLVRTEQTQFTLPDYLLREQSRSDRVRRLLGDDSGTGSGLVWTGALVATASVIFTQLDSWGAIALALGVALVLAGFWRMRFDLEALSRAGLAIMALATVTLGAILFQVLGPQQGVRGGEPGSSLSRSEPPSTSSHMAPVATPVARELDSAAMFGGTADHAGVYPGPGPLGRPVTNWRRFTGGEVYSSPVIVGDTVFVGTKSGFLAAYDAATGQERWRFDLGGYIVRATPAVADGVAYIGAGYGLFAIDAETGNELWRMPIRFAGSASPTVAGDTVFMATQEGHIYAVETETGTERWHYEADGLIFGAPAVAGGRVYFASDSGGVHVLAADTGRLAWRMNIGLQIRASPTVADGGAYFNTEQPALIAFDEASGDERWRTEVGGESTPAVAQDLVLFGSAENGLYAVEASSGQLRWLFPTGNAVLSAPAVAGDTVYVGSGSTLYAVDIVSGTALWSYPAGELIMTSPAIHDGVVYFGSRDGFLYAVGGETEAADS